MVLLTIQIYRFQPSSVYDSIVPLIHQLQQVPTKIHSDTLHHPWHSMLNFKKIPITFVHNKIFYLCTKTTFQLQNNAS